MGKLEKIVKDVYHTTTGLQVRTPKSNEHSNKCICTNCLLIAEQGAIIRVLGADRHNVKIDYRNRVLGVVEFMMSRRTFYKLLDEGKIK